MAVVALLKYNRKIAIEHKIKFLNDYRQIKIGDI